MQLSSLIIMLPSILVLLFLIYTIVRSIGRAWLDHRVKLAMLERLERRPDLVRSIHDLQELVDAPESDSEEAKQDYVLTGVLLAAIGLACAVLYAMLGGGRWAVGAYFGGVACVALGFLLAIIGLFVRFVTRTPVEPKRPWRERIQSYFNKE